MSNEETNPDLVADQVAPDQSAKPETAAPVVDGQPSGDGGTAPSQEDDRFATLERKFDDLTKGMNTAQRDAASARAEAEFYKDRTQALAGVAPPTKSQEDQLWDTFEQTGDLSDLRSWQSVHDDNLSERVGRKVMGQMAVDRAMPAAGEMLGIDNQRELAQRLVHVKNTATPDELAFLDLKREGKLDAWMEEDRKAKEYRAREAAMTGPNGMNSGGHRVPGQGGITDRVIMPWAEWVALNPEAKARHRKDFDNPNREYVFSDVPESIKARGFDPRQDQEES